MTRLRQRRRDSHLQVGHVVGSTRAAPQSHGEPFIQAVMDELRSELNPNSIKKYTCGDLPHFYIQVLALQNQQ